MDTSYNPYITTPTAATNAISTGVQNAASSFTPIPMPSLPTTGDLSGYYQSAFQALQPYYQAKLSLAKGDLTEAMRQITYDYQTGMRYNTQDTGIGTTRANEDLESALQTLGLTTKKESQQQMDDLNKRGIATVQGVGPGTAKAASGSRSDVSYDSSGNPVYSGSGGQAGSEIAMLREDQGLRKEALQRSNQRTLQDVAIKSDRTTAQLGETQGRSTYSAERQAQDTAASIGQEQQQQAYNIASQESTAASAAKSAQAQADEARAYQNALKQSA